MGGDTTTSAALVRAAAVPLVPVKLQTAKQRAFAGMRRVLLFENQMKNQQAQACAFFSGLLPGNGSDS